MSNCGVTARWRGNWILKPTMWKVAGILLSVPVWLGCEPAKMRVWGTVSLDGQAVKDGAIEFVPIEGTRGKSYGGPIVAGRYEVPAQTGMPPRGVYRVELRGFRQESAPDRLGSGRQMQVSVNYLPPGYGPQSPLKISVSADPRANEHDFKLTSSSE